ncbi:PIR protein [Plasmodium vivax]|nr:PIR protein [Plasmodium vivax]
MRNTSYDVENMYHISKGILETWVPRLSGYTSEDCIAFKEQHIRKHKDTFVYAQCSKAQHYLSKIEKSSDPQYISNACKYFMYWLYYDVLNKETDNSKILRIYEDVLTGYIEGTGNVYLKDYVSFLSEEKIEKIIKLTKMYDSFYNFKGNMQHGSNKCNHAEECIRLYKENIEVCEEGNDNDFCYELDNLKENYDTYMMSKEVCSHLTRTLESYKVYNPAVPIISPISILLVISLSLFFLYKFTPFGSIFRKRTKNNKKIADNLDYAMNVLPHTSQRVNNYNNNRQYNISYLSSGQ